MSCAACALFFTGGIVRRSWAFELNDERKVKLLVRVPPYLTLVMGQYLT